MDIWETNNLVLFIAFVIPGFIMMKSYELLVPSAQVDTAKNLVDAISYSCINYAFLAWPIIMMEGGEVRISHPNYYASFYMFVLFGFPILLAFMWRFLRTRQWVQNTIAHPTLIPWDYVFSERIPYWIKVTLKDGTKLAGKYADKSFASSYPAKEQLYLEESWIVNEQGGLERPKNRTAGVMILSSEITHLEFFHYYNQEGKKDE